MRQTQIRTPQSQPQPDARIDQLACENPDQAIVRAIFENPTHYSSELLRRVATFVEGEALLDPDSDAALEWLVIHALRILTAWDDERVLPYLFKILDRFGDEWELILVDTTHLALEYLAKPEHFEIYWSEYERVRSIASRYDAQLEDDLHEAELAMLGHAASCRVQDPRLQNELRNWFSAEPSRIANQMVDNQDSAFLPLLESHLRKIAPIRKYVPFDRTRVPEHDAWFEMGSAWLYFTRKVQGRLSDWEKARDEPKLGLERFYRKEPDLSPQERKKSYENAIRERDDDQGELAAYFLKDLPSHWTPSTDVFSRGFVSDVDARISSYLSAPPGPRLPFQKIGRNEACACGSGKKFKKCCGK